MSIIPFEAALNCTRCGNNEECTQRCETFYQLMHAMTDVHSQYEKLEALKAENSDDQELEVLSIILNRLSEQACTVVSVQLSLSLNRDTLRVFVH